MADLTQPTAACCTPAEQASCCEPDDKAACCDSASAGGTCGCAEGATSATASDIREAVRERYAAAARAIADQDQASCGCAPVTTTDATGAQVFGGALYDQGEVAGATATAVEASLGCGVPTAVADLHPGETVLDLGSGAGADVLISARRVAPTGRAIGLDMTDEMLELARRNAAEAGVENVEFIEGHIEEIPLPDDSVDVVISNCVINLSADKPRVLREAARVLAPGGRLAVSDVIADPHLDDATRADMAAWTGLHRRRAHGGPVPLRACRGRTDRHRDPAHPPRPRARERRDRPRGQARVNTGPCRHVSQNLSHSCGI
jgi:SAM-dependent methyltransferase